MESEFFITEFVGDFHTRMDCSLKVLFSDFIVNEITSDGKIVVVGSSSEDKEIFQETEGTAGIHPTSIKRKVTRPDSVSDFLESEIDALLIDKRSTVKIPVEGLNKVQRTEIHEWIREKYSEKLNTETKDKAIIVSSTSLRTRKRDSWPSDRPDYCHFTLSKENMDSHYALSLISRFLGRSVASFGVLGTKDRRAVTSQRVSAYHIDRAKISSLNDRLRGIQLSDFCYKDDPCTLGNLWGNRFSIVLRNIPNNFDGDELTKRIDNWKTKGFVNYYGTQRFGSCGLNTAYVGRAILQKHYQEAVRMILQNHQAKGCLGDALTVWNESSDAEAAARHLRGAQTFASIESQILLSLSRSGSDWSAAIRRLPRNSRSLYIHAYQSLVWNKVVSRRIKECGLVQLEGDLDEQGKELEMVDQEATVYLPLPSATMKLPSNRVGGWYEEILEEDGINTEHFASLEKQFALGDVLRPMIMKPTDVSYKILKYSNPKEQLQPGLNNDASFTPANDGELRALLIQFSLPCGTYATVALRELTRCDMSKMGQISSEASEVRSSDVITTEES